MDAAATKALTEVHEGFRLSPRAVVMLTAVVGALVATRLLWDRFLDPFEDGYQNWWIGSVLAQTGRYEDPFSGMTRGNWLPGYTFMVAGFTGLFGSRIMPLLKGVNILFSLGTTGVVYALARPKGRYVALLAVGLFVLSPTDVVISSFATAEALALFTTFLGVLLVERPLLGPRASIVVASATFAIASTLRYEVWGFLALYLGWTLASRSVGIRRVAILAGPAVAWVAFWWVWTSQYGFLPAIIVGQTSVDVQYKATIGLLPPLWSRLGTFFGFYFFYAPFALLSMIWGLKRELRSPFTWILFFFYGAEVVYTAANWGNPGPRYIHLTTPIVAIYSAEAIAWVRGWLRSRTQSARRWNAHAPAVVSLAISAGLVLLVLNPTPPPGTLLQGMQRAGAFLESRPLPAGKLLVSESPIAAYYSGYPASRIIGSNSLSGNASVVDQYLLENVAYVVLVTVPYYRLRTLFPEQANGTNGNHLVLLYDATGPEYALGAPRVLVFEVAP
jgi:hypothetical protein